MSGLHAAAGLSPEGLNKTPVEVSN